MVAVEMANGDVVKHDYWESVATQPVVDVTGAGDQVLATIGVMLSRGHSWIESCQIANIAAGIKCGKRGTQPTTAEELSIATAPLMKVDEKSPVGGSRIRAKLSLYPVVDIGEQNRVSIPWKIP